MVKCEDMSYYMSLYLDGEVTESERKEFEDHIASCELCRREFDKYKAIFQGVKQLPEYELPNGFHEEVMAEIRENQMNRGVGLLSGFRSLVPAAASMIGVFVLLSAVINSINLSYGIDQTEYIMSEIAEDYAGEFKGEAGILPESAGRTMMEPEGFKLEKDESEHAEDALQEIAQLEIPAEELTGKLKSYYITITAENVDEIRSYILGLNGKTEYEYGSADYASITKRISNRDYDTLIEEIRGIKGISITYVSNYTSDIKNEINDISKRMNSLIEEREKLLQLLLKSENVSDVVKLTERISTVEETINNYNVQLSNFAYYEQWPEVSVYISQKYSNQEPDMTMSEKIREYFISGINMTAQTMENIIIGGVFIFVPILLLSLLATVGFVIVKAFKKDRGDLNDKK